MFSPVSFFSSKPSGHASGHNSWQGQAAPVSCGLCFSLKSPSNRTPGALSSLKAYRALCSNLIRLIFTTCWLYWTWIFIIWCFYGLLLTHFVSHFFKLLKPRAGILPLCPACSYKAILTLLEHWRAGSRNFTWIAQNLRFKTKHLNNVVLNHRSAFLL